MKNAVAFFDFDGTITTHDSYREFLMFCFGKKRFIAEILLSLHYLIAFMLKIIDNQAFKQRITRKFFAGMPTERFDRLAKAFVERKLETIVKAKALRCLEWHKAQGHRVIVVSASFEGYLRFWCQKHGVEIIGTRLEVKNNLLTGKFNGENCYGPEKVRRIKDYCQLTNKYIYAYGDSKGDTEMLLAANEGFMVNKGRKTSHIL